MRWNKNNYHSAQQALKSVSRNPSL